ncbi:MULTISPECIES: hypothetical protein [unclassified Streptomyces]|uniref:hypothetical protein n=1 Tax=Streptomyces sp. NPDC127129 TaxID=3345373 RepID=UPI00362F20A6
MPNDVIGRPHPIGRPPRPADPGDYIPYMPPWDFVPQPQPWCDKLPWIIRATTRELELLKGASEEVRKKHFEKTLNGLKEDGVLEEGEVEALIGAATGARAVIPSAVTPDGAPSLCGMIGANITPGLARSSRDLGMAAGAAVGAAAGAAVGGVGGAIAGAALGALAAGALMQQ